MALHHAPHQGEPHPFTRGGIGMKALKNREDFRLMGLGDAEAIVLHVYGLAIDLDRPRRRATSPISTRPGRAGSR